MIELKMVPKVFTHSKLTHSELTKE